MMCGGEDGVVFEKNEEGVDYWGMLYSCFVFICNKMARHIGILCYPLWVASPCFNTYAYYGI